MTLPTEVLNIGRLCQPYFNGIMHEVTPRQKPYNKQTLQSDELVHMEMAVAAASKRHFESLPEIRLYCQPDRLKNHIATKSLRPKLLPQTYDAQRLCITLMDGETHITVTRRVFNGYKLHQADEAGMTVSMHVCIDLKLCQPTPLWGRRINDLLL